MRHYEWIQNSEGRMKCVQRLDKSTFSFSSGKRKSIRVRTTISLDHASLYEHFIEGF